MTMTLPPPVIVETLYCKRCDKDCPKAEFVALLRDIRAGAKARGLPLLTVWKHKPSVASRKTTPEYVGPCGYVVYSLERA